MEYNLDMQIKDLTDKIAKSSKDDNLFYERGKLYWKTGKRAEAITDFNAAILINPHSPAADYLNMVNEIMDFYNTDLYNP